MDSVKLRAAIIAISLATLLVGQRSANAQSWGNGYAFRRAITISHANVSNSDQTNFPLLFAGTYPYLATISNGGGVLNSNGYDIIFTSDSAGTTRLSFERQSYNSTTGAAVFWVKIPTLSHTTDTTIYLFYCNSSVSTDQSTKTSTWDGNYVGVWHMDDNAATTAVADSTSHANNGTAAANTNAKSVVGMIGNALSFNGSTDKVTTTLTRTSTFTWEAWFYQASSGSYQSILTIDGSNYELMDLYGSSGSFWSADGLGGVTLSVTGISQDTWNHLVFVRSGDSSSTGYSAYLNGVLKGQASSGTLASGNTITFGYRPDYGQPFYGNLDEIRVSNIARTSDWIATEYRNESSSSTFYSVSDPQTSGSSPYIFAISPTAGPVTTPVTILGANFDVVQGSSTASFNATTAPTTQWSSTEVVVPVPTSATSGSVVVTVAGTASNGVAFTVTTAPGITRISPTSGMVGTMVTLTGVNFGTTQGSSTVVLNGTNCPVLSWNPNSIAVTVPSGATTGSFSVNVSGQVGTSPVFAVTPVPTGWTDSDVGGVGLAGSASFASGTFTISGAGSQIWSTADGMNFAYQPLIGNGTLIARLSSFNGSSIAQAGLMIRETLNPSATNFFTGYQPNIAYFSYRTSTGASTSRVSGGSANPPTWFMIVRSGSSFSAYNSTNGIDWTQIGSTQTITMAQNAYIGLAVTSGSTSTLATATFDYVSLSNSTVTPPIISQISTSTGPAGTPVAISGSGFGAVQGGSAVYLNGIPLTISSWSATAINATIPTGGSSGWLVVSVGPGMVDSNPVQFEITSSPLPSPWLNRDIGAVGATGSSTFSNRVFTVNGAGQGFTATPDSLQFAYQALHADGAIIARVSNISGSSVQAGVMIRETLNAGATGAFVYFQPNTAALAYRPSTNASPAFLTTGFSAPAYPYWVQLVRTGNTFIGYISSDGYYWTAIGSQTISMAENAYIGLAVSSTSSSNLAAVTFDNVSVSFTTSPAPTISGLSATTGSVGSQFVIYGTGFGSMQGSSGVTLNGSPLTVASWSSTSITVTIPSGASTGLLGVFVAPGMNSSNTVWFTVTSQPLATTWLDSDIGNYGLVGSATYANGVFTVKAAGQGISGTADGFHFVYQPFSGDGSITARVANISGGSTSTQVGVMIRESLHPDAKDAFVFFNPNTAALYTRTSTTGSTTSQTASYVGPSYPVWLRLTRSGSALSGYISEDGNYWTQIASQSISMAQNVFVGLAVSNFTTGSMATATFDSVSVNSDLLTPPVISALSATTGPVGTAVTVIGTGFGASQGTSTVLLNDNPVTVNSWSANSISITIPTGSTSGYLEVLLGPSMNSSNGAVFTVTSQPLPSGWLDTDIGNFGIAGSATYSGGTFTVIGAGQGVASGGTADGLHFVYQTVSGNAVLVARVSGIQNETYSDQVGIMIRETTGAGASNMFLYYYPNAAYLPYRTSTGAGTTASSSSYAASYTPYWVKMSRSGSSFTAYISPDGVNWTQVGTAQTINMANTVDFGLAVSSYSTGTALTATLDNVSIAQGTMPIISGVSPAVGTTGTSVTISGSNFGSSQGSSYVYFNGVAATSVTSWGNSQIIAAVPSTATTGPVTVKVNSIQSNTNYGFTFYNPVITSLSPPSAEVGAIFTINGSGFGNTQNYGFGVTINGVAARIASWSNSSIQVFVDPTTTSGPVAVTLQGVTSNTLPFSVEALSVTGISPTSGVKGTPVTISGTGFGASQTSSTVDFNGTIASVQSWSDTQIVALVPAGTVTGSVNVTVGSIEWYGPTFTISQAIQIQDSKSNTTTYNLQMIGGLWVASSTQGSACSTCSVRGNVSYTYDSSGRTLSATDENNNTTSYTYDSVGNLLSVTAPISSGHTATTSYTYNGFGEVLTTIDPLGNVTTNTYDANGNLLSVTTPSPGNGASSSVTQFAYNSLGELTQITDPLGNQTNIAYFSTGMIQTITDAQSNITTYAYDSKGNRTSVTDANNKQTTFAYDAMNRLTKITYPDSTTTQFGYDVRGRRTSATDQNSKVTSYAYDDADRLIGVNDANLSAETGCIGTDSSKHSACYGYDTESNLTSITDANDNTTNFTYDPFRRVTKTQFPSGSVEQYGYDNVGNLISKTDRKNQQITYTYDQLNRLTKKTYPDTTTVNYIFDDDSRLTQVTDPTGTYAFTFDNMGRLTGTTTNYSFLTTRSFTTSYGYDAASNRTTFIDSENGSTSYAYDTLNRLQTLAPPAAISGGSFGFGYDALSRRTSLTRPNSVNTTYSYDNLSRLLSVTHAKGSTTLDGASYGLDNAGNRTSKTDLYANLTTNYGYDSLYELLSATQSGTTKESYTYDSVGNRLTQLGSAAWTYNTSNELNSRPNVSYTYDANGNTTSKSDSSGTTTYSWDYDNRLTSVTPPGSNGIVSYRYDPFDRRIYKSSSSETSVYAYDAANVIEETNGTGALVARYSQGQDIDEPLVMLRNSTTSYFDADGLSSITSLTNAAGAIAANYTYDSFGNIVATSGSIVNSFRYTGREFDSETNLYYYRARYFDPISGRFLSEDPLEFDGGMDFYVYTQNDPVGLVDPSGMQPGPDSNGFWPANLNDPELAPLIVWPYPSSQKFYGVNQECVSLTRKFTGLPCTDCWRPGPKVIGNTIPAGTAIGTFDQNGRYPQESGVNKNSGIYVKTFPGNAILIIDQWGPHPGSPAHPAKARVLNPRPGDTSNDSGSYSVITVPRGTTSKKCKCGNW